MFELTSATVAEYLRSRGIEPVRVTELADGVSNAVLCIGTAAGKFVLKQSRPQLRTRDPWFSDITRIWRERDAMQLLRPLLPTGVVPEVLWSDAANFAFAMSHAPEPFRNWRSVILTGEVNVQLGELAGRLLGAIHSQTARQIDSLQHFIDRTVFEQLRVEPFYLRVQKRRPELAEALQPLIDRCRNLRLGLCHGDFSPKNLLLHDGGFTLVDYETCHVGDIAFDLGFFLSHLLLKSIYVSAARETMRELMRTFWRGYTGSSLLSPELMAAAIAHTGGCLMARIDGASPAPYLVDEGWRNHVREWARRILLDRPGDWEQVLP